MSLPVLGSSFEDSENRVSRRGSCEKNLQLERSHGFKEICDNWELILDEVRLRDIIKRYGEKYFEIFENCFLFGKETRIRAIKVVRSNDESEKRYIDQYLGNNHSINGQIRDVSTIINNSLEFIVFVDARSFRRERKRIIES